MEVFTLVHITPFIKKNSGPLYVQVYDDLRTKIMEGKIPFGSKLPSIRGLARHLHVSNNTISLAYDLLADEDFIERKPRSGIYVKKQIEDIFPFPHSSEEDRKVEYKPSPRYDFRYGTLNSTLFPAKTFHNIANAIYAERQQELFTYGDVQGEFGLRKEVHHYLINSRGVKCAPEQIIITSGTQQSLILLSQILNLPDKLIGLEEPGYNGARIIFENLNVNVEPIPIKNDGLSIEELYKINPYAVYVTPSHQFPTGVIMTQKKRKQLLQWARDHHSFIIEDDYDSEFRYVGKPIQAIQGMDEAEKVIYLGTFSKLFLPSMRMSYIVLPSPLLSIYKELFSLYEQTVPRLQQWIMEAFMKTNYLNKHIARMRNAYRKKHTVLIAEITKRFDSNKFEILGECSGLHILVKVYGKSEEELIKLAFSKDVKVYPTSPYWKRKAQCETGTVLLGFGSLSEEEIQQGVSMLSEVWM